MNIVLPNELWHIIWNYHFINMRLLAAFKKLRINNTIKSLTTLKYIDPHQTPPQYSLRYSDIIRYQNNHWRRKHIKSSIIGPKVKLTWIETTKKTSNLIWTISDDIYGILKVFNVRSSHGSNITKKN